MKKRLNDLVLWELIELACGNYDVLKDDHRPVPAEWLPIYARSILSEYSFIADSIHAKAVMSEKENELKESANIMLLKICRTLIDNGGMEQAKNVLSEIGESTDGDVSERVDNLLRYAEFEHNRTLQSKEDIVQHTPEEVRSSFYSELAFMMTYFKMNINEREINAQVYANMVRQAGIEIRSKNIGR